MVACLDMQLAAPKAEKWAAWLAVQMVVHLDGAMAVRSADCSALWWVAWKAVPKAERMVVWSGCQRAEWMADCSAGHWVVQMVDDSVERWAVSLALSSAGWMVDSMVAQSAVELERQ